MSNKVIKTFVMRDTTDTIFIEDDYKILKAISKSDDIALEVYYLCDEYASMSYTTFSIHEEGESFYGFDFECVVSNTIKTELFLFSEI